MTLQTHLTANQSLNQQEQQSSASELDTPGVDPKAALASIDTHHAASAANHWGRNVSPKYRNAVGVQVRIDGGGGGGNGDGGGGGDGDGDGGGGGGNGDGDGGGDGGDGDDDEARWQCVGRRMVMVMVMVVVMMMVVVMVVVMMMVVMVMVMVVWWWWWYVTRVVHFVVGSEKCIFPASNVRLKKCNDAIHGIRGRHSSAVSWWNVTCKPVTDR